jgi:hypothetical protein
MAKAIHKETSEAGIDWRLVTAIFFKESSLRLDPQNCRENECEDYGLGQVRFSVWGEHFNIDRERMISDVRYSVHISVKVLKTYKQRYESTDLNWFTRYHSNKPELRHIYEKQLNKIFQAIDRHIASAN